MRPVTLGAGPAPPIDDPFLRWIADALREIEAASQDTLQDDTSSSGNALATVHDAAADQVAYFVSETETAFMTVTAAARSILDDTTVGAIVTTLGAVPATRQVISGDGLTGGGDLTADRTLAVGAGAGLTVAADAIGMTDMAAGTVKGRATGAGTGAPTDLTAAQQRENAGLSYGKQTIWVPAGAMKPRATSPAVAGTYDSGTNDVTLSTLEFADASALHAQFHIAFPKSWNNGTVTFVPYWTATSGSGDVRWAVSAVAVSDDDTLNATMGTAQNSDDTLIAADDLHVGPESSAITIGGTPATGDMTIFNITRDTGNDTLSGTALLIGVKVLFSVAAGNDD